MAAAEQSVITPEQYLEIERKAEFKSEYISGQMFARQGASKEHVAIEINLIGEIRNRLRNSPCRAGSSNMRVQVDYAGPYFYPDVIVYCKDAIWLDKQSDTLTNPHVIFEVLSPSTEHYDRGEKAFHYRRIKSLTDLVFIEQRRVRIEHYHREGDGWLLTDITDIDNVLKLVSLGIELPINEIYRDVEFPPVLMVREPQVQYTPL